MADAHTCFSDRENNPFYIPCILGVFLTALLVQGTLASPCGKSVPSCPTDSIELSRRKAMYACSDRYFYTCLPTSNFTGYFERCSPDYPILNGTGGCPYIVKCDEDLGFILGSTNTFNSCPEEVEGCPPVYHAKYSIKDLYQYPACYYRNGKIPSTSTMTTSNQAYPFKRDSSCEQTSAIRTVVISVFINTSIVIVILCFYHKRKKMKGICFARLKVFNGKRNSIPVSNIEDNGSMTFEKNTYIDKEENTEEAVKPQSQKSEDAEAYPLIDKENATTFDKCNEVEVNRKECVRLMSLKSAAEAAPLNDMDKATELEETSTSIKQKHPENGSDSNPSSTDLSTLVDDVRVSYKDENQTRSTEPHDKKS